MLRLPLIIALLFTGVLCSQGIVCSVEDRNVFNSKVEAIKDLPNEAAGTLLVSVGSTFLGTPYVAGTLEIGEIEQLVINLQGLDCTTFVENVLALSLLIREQDTSFDNYAKALQKIRYRDGQLTGYASRLHYFSEWIRDNEKKGLVKDMSIGLGGLPSGKTLNFMTSNRELYPRLSDPGAFQKMEAVERQLENQPYSYIPGKVLIKRVNDLRHGDIIALATNINGLDVTHTGIVFRKENGVLHLLHASSRGQVEVSEKPLLDYLSGVKGNTGILVARPIF
ncbi:N-acetylmuramoyl-L-alanine amidase-like domain-containing protein [Lentiprolixibacter aurantiacus]|uniref:DUF1460 domain-containing protein n=1 Tax=Lentiprolixibacter aurantiacus TaxID=2993939 RepID=A0AAE3MJV8_9FLAO|nr:N-acetylmuramoyl-L-alanine amidase-like domain-containing protein [Lentiprolixibacter aurantiacus]MCX2718671.1 DUF1460 domain-containing protein [Lentiprolixibacter aurantiacus]